MTNEEMTLEEQLRKNIGKHIRGIRKLKGMSVDDLAYYSEINRSYIGDLERGEANISLFYLYKISIGLNLPSPLELTFEAEKVIYTELKEELWKEKY
ncbi:helix-turn-helix domain-containing protein [Desertibacillus haloalkaliphilus]|uniref:helix-turn-helix domain-containing protein n=1 Tax=Desertibacillus haloalkaliphilus TaxID=1328930 RepID=UPI001C270B24|nr:helix-turn-helix transcriptional regulator [Desertibacillus haloalkaliphilus]MBU8906534.1 helix-turn-helix transcriptional regulator [Desertibacillus haloalkaliphilus]